MVFGMMLTKVDGPTLFWAGRFMSARVCGTVPTVQSPSLSSFNYIHFENTLTSGLLSPYLPRCINPTTLRTLISWNRLENVSAPTLPWQLTQLFNVISLSGTSPSLTTSDRSPLRNVFLKVNHPVSRLWSSLDQTLAIRFQAAEPLTLWIQNAPFSRTFLHGN